LASLAYNSKKIRLKSVKKPEEEFLERFKKIKRFSILLYNPRLFAKDI
jgi:hypothetical protein